jgi:hypothetical protein
MTRPRQGVLIHGAFPARRNLGRKSSGVGSPRERLLTRVEAADYLSISPWTLIFWHRRGHGPRYLKLSRGIVRYRWADLQAFLRGCALRPSRSKRDEHSSAQGSGLDQRAGRSPSGSPVGMRRTARRIGDSLIQPRRG